MMTTVNRSPPSGNYQGPGKENGKVSDGFSYDTSLRFGGFFCFITLAIAKGLVAIIHTKL